METKDFTFRIEGGHRLKGNVFVQGSKNAILPMIAAALIPKSGYTVIRNVPPLNDILVALEIVKATGADVQYSQEEQMVAICASRLSNAEMPADLTELVRACVLFIPPLLLRLGYCRLPTVGGCGIGARKLDFHYRGFARLGALVNDRDGLEVRVNGLKGADLYLDLPSHTGTENLMMLACLSKGTTIIENASSDPEVVDFGNFLMKMGAKIEGLGTRTICVEGVDELCAVDHTAMPDRLDAGAFIMAAGITRGQITLVGAELRHLRLFKEKVSQMGMRIIEDGALVHAIGCMELKPVNVVTWPYPGFATDLQPGLMTLACAADGTSYIRELIFENRFGQAHELRKMGADIEVRDERLAVVNGPWNPMGTEVRAGDIRGGVALVLAGLAAEGKTTITNVYQIDRGHYALDSRLSRLGAGIERVPAGKAS